MLHRNRWATAHAGKSAHFNALTACVPRAVFLDCCSPRLPLPQSNKLSKPPCSARCPPRRHWQRVAQLPRATALPVLPPTTCSCICPRPVQTVCNTTPTRFCAASATPRSCWRAPETSRTRSCNCICWGARKPIRPVIHSTPTGSSIRRWRLKMWASHAGLTPPTAISRAQTGQ
jgi:hypothetical protein